MSFEPRGRGPHFYRVDSPGAEAERHSWGLGPAGNDQCLFWVQAHTASVTRQEDSGGLPEGRVPGIQEQFEAEQA